MLKVEYVGTRWRENVSLSGFCLVRHCTENLKLVCFLSPRRPRGTRRVGCPSPGIGQCRLFSSCRHLVEFTSDISRSDQQTESRDSHDGPSQVCHLETGRARKSKCPELIADPVTLFRLGSGFPSAWKSSEHQMDTGNLCGMRT